MENEEEESEQLSEALIEWLALKVEALRRGPETGSLKKSVPCLAKPSLPKLARLHKM
jgi:hypothetical protein